MNMQTLKDEWGTGKAWIDHFTRDFPNLQTLADGSALSQQRNAPQVGVTTLMNATRQIPRQSVQQIPILSAQINGTELSLDAIVATYLLRRVVFNEDTFGTGVLSTMQMATQQAMTVGFAVLRANVGKIFNQFSTMLETIHYNDIVIEPGIFDASNSQYYHVRTRVTKGALKSLLDSAKAKGKKKTLWNVAALQELYDNGPQPFNYNSYLPPSRQNAGMQGEDQYDIITRYGVGPYYDITVYSPQATKPLMEIKSKSKFGFPRVSFLVIDPDQLSPFGISRTKLASPMANYGNIYLQSTAKMQLMNADPPSFKKGLFTSATPLRRGAQYESVDPNADFRFLELSNSTLEQFDSVMGYVDRNILTTMGINGVGAPGQNSAYQNKDAVQAQNQVTDLASQQVTSIVENGIRQYALTALDLYISEQTGETPLIVDDEAKNAINQIMPPEVTIDPVSGMPIEGEPFVGDDNVVNVDWEKFYDRIETMTVKVELSITPDNMADKKRSELQDTLVTMSQNADPNDPSAQTRKRAVEDELLKDMAPGAARAAENMDNQMPASQPAVGGIPTPPEE